MGGGNGEFTQGLEAPRPIDDSSSMRSLFPLVYRELKAVAHRQLGRAPGHSFDTTGLVHEVYFKLADMDRSVVKDRSHFLAISARAMRQVLVAAARKRHRVKRGSGVRPSTFDDSNVAQPVALEHVLQVNEALEKLQRLDPRLGQVVECRFFAGLTEEDTAEALDVSLSTVQRDCRRAKAWLHRYLKDSTAP
ncbi:MAG: ECF-type sigma factor [Acidobacteriota bacterium]